MLVEMCKWEEKKQTSYILMHQAHPSIVLRVKEYPRGCGAWLMSWAFTIPLKILMNSIIVY